MIYCKHFHHIHINDLNIDLVTFMDVFVFQQWVGQVEISALAVMYK